jgi:hypothetical protein
MLASLSQKRGSPQKHARRRVAAKEEEEEQEEENEVSDKTMSRHFRRSPDPVVVDLTAAMEGRTLVVGPEDALLCGPCKDNGIISHGARHLCRCEHQLAATVVNRRVKLILQSLKNTHLGDAVKRGMELPTTPPPDVVKAIKTLGTTDKKLNDLGPVGTAALEKIVDDYLTTYWSSKGFPVAPLVSAGMPDFVKEVSQASKVKIEDVARRYNSPERGRYGSGSPERGHYDSRGRERRRSSGGRRRYHRHSRSTSSGSSDSRGKLDRKYYKTEYGRGGPGGPPEGPTETPEGVAPADAAAIEEAARVSAAAAPPPVPPGGPGVPLPVPPGGPGAQAQPPVPPVGPRVRGPDGRWRAAP